MLELDGDCLNLYFRFFTTFGMWNPFDEFDAKRRLYFCYAIAITSLVGMTPCTGEIIHAWNSKNDITMFTQHFTLVAAMGSTIAKIVNIWHCRPDIEIASDLLNWERRQPCNRKFAFYRNKIITSTIRACKIFSLIFIIMVLWYCSFSYVKDFIYHKGNMNKISISPVLSLPSNVSSTYWMLMFTIDKMAVAYIAGCTACHDLFFMAFLMHVSAQLDLLKQRLEYCQKKIHDNNIENYYDLCELKIESICRTIQQEFFLDPVVELRTCIKHHQKILRYVNLVQSIFNETLLLQFVTSLLIITMAGFQMFGERQLNQNEMIDTVNFLMCAIFQLFLYCWFGTDVIVKSESISMSAYNSEWYVADKNYKKTLRILLCRGQIPIVFRAGAICELSSTTFMNASDNKSPKKKTIISTTTMIKIHTYGMFQIISKCYSSMALLKRVNE